MDLVLEVKTDDENMCQMILGAMEPVAKKVCSQAGVANPPEVQIFARAPLTLNNASLVGALRESSGKHLREEHDQPQEPAEPHGTPYVMWHLGRQRSCHSHAL